MLTVNNLSIQYSDRVLFDGISFQVNEMDIIGLTGLNGAGKSTLLKILARIQNPDEGEVNTPNEYTIGYLPQQLTIAADKTVMESAAEAFSQLQSLEDKMNELQEKISDHHDYQSDDYAELVEKLTAVSHQFELLGGDNIEKDIERVLKGLGFMHQDMNRPLSEFSGGWQMRVELAKILLRQPDLLLLDEPTNHLDIESIMWLEDFLKSYPGAVIMVSHDRALLDHITNRTLEIENGNVYDYKANYSKYLELRKERREKLIAEKKNQDKYVEHTEQLINKFRAKKNKAAFAQSLIKKLDRLEKIEIDETDTSSIKLQFPEPPRSGKVVVDARHVHKQYGDHEVLKDVNFQLERGNKIAFVGKNGEGKTTLSKIIAQTIPYEGKVDLGHNVSLGYYAQHQEEMLDGERTVFQTIDDVATGEMRTKVRSLLGAFLFSGDDVQKKVKVLSGGEKSRLSLAKLLLEPVNLLILDEPTNHLDMRSKEILKNSLIHFSGAMIIVSHDREFLEGLTERVYEFRNGGINEYLGDIRYFLKKREITHIDEVHDLGKKEKPAAKQAAKPVNTYTNKEWYEKKKQVERDERKMKNQVRSMERTIEDLEKKIAELESQIHQPEFYEKAKDPQQIFNNYEQYKKRLNQEMEKWAKDQEAHEKLIAERDELMQSQPGD